MEASVSIHYSIQLVARRHGYLLFGIPRCIMRSLPLSQFIIGMFSLLTLVTSISQYGGVSAYGAGYMPTIISSFLLAFTALDFMIHLHQRKENIKFSLLEIRALLLIILSLGLFTILITYLGFLVCAALLLFYLMSIRNPKKIIMNAVYSTISSGVIYYVFGYILMVALPDGMWS
jgi:putative tricarboxylic transport membrane protein